MLQSTKSISIATVAEVLKIHIFSSEQVPLSPLVFELVLAQIDSIFHKLFWA